MWSWSYFQAPESLRLKFFLNNLLILFGYRGGSAAALLAGVLPLRYCSARLACRFPNWKLPDKGHVCEFVTDSVVDDRVLGCDGVCRFLSLALLVVLVFSVRVGFLGALKDFHSTEKHQHTLQDLVVRGVYRLVLKFGRVLMCCMSVIIVMMGLLWVTWVGSRSATGAD